MIVVGQVWIGIEGVNKPIAVSVLNTEANVLNLMEDGTAKPGAIQIACSMVDDEAFDESDGNLPGVPTWTPAGCVDAPTCDSAPIGPDVCE